MKELNENFEVEVLTKDLSHILSLILPVIEKNSIISIKVEENKLEFTVTNDTNMITHSIGGKISMEGEISIKYPTSIYIIGEIRNFLNKIKIVPDDFCLLYIINNKLYIKTNNCDCCISMSKSVKHEFLDNTHFNRVNNININVYKKWKN